MFPNHARQFAPGLARVVVLACALLFAGCGDDVPPMSPLSAGATVLAFGDSLTYGTGANHDTTSYPTVLARLIGRPVVNAGVPGEVSAEGLRRLPDLIEEHMPKLVVLCHGGNDLLRKLDLNVAKNNLREMVVIARASGAQVLLVGVPKPAIVLATAEFYDTLADELGLPYVRDGFADILGDRTLKADAFHPNAAGYRRFAETVANYLRAARAI
jgi:acyl-CoA thioesterase I